MYQTLCGAYRVPNGPSKVKEASNPSKVVMREHEYRLRTFVPTNGSNIFGIGRQLRGDKVQYNKQLP